MASCERPQLKQLLYRHVRGELENPGERREVTQHIQDCAECRSIFQELQWVLGSMRPTTPDEHRQLMDELRRNDAHGPMPAGATGSGRASGSARPGLLQRLKRWLESGGGGS